MNDSGTTHPATPLFSNRLYDALKYIALVVLPALGSLYFGLDQIWGLPKAVEVVGTIAVLDTFLGVVLRKSNHTYQHSDARFDGTIDKIEDEDTTVYSLNLEGDPHEVLEQKDEVLFKVQDSPSESLSDVQQPAPMPKPRKRGKKMVDDVDV